MHTGFSTNEYGTRISIHVCETCGRIFTVCPAAEEDAKGWDDCLTPTCSSYDPDRDVDKLFEDGDPIADGRIQKLETH